MDRLVLNEFKDAYKALQPYLMKPLDFLVYGLLVWLQEKVIDYKTTAAVDQAIKEFEQAEVKEPPLTTGVYSETGSGFFDEMRMTAKYLVDDDDKST
jgi:hypothetical protein